MNNINERVETFVVLATLDSIELANRITAAFEDMGIPVMLEHINSDEDSGSSFKLSTQPQFLENASRVVENMLIAHDTRKIVTSKSILNN